MSMKLGRNYVLFAEGNGQTFEINFSQQPFTLEFDITRNSLSSANVSSIRIYNLAKNVRQSLYFNRNNQTADRTIVLYAGYGTNLPIVFSGNIQQCWSVREGVNFITEIHCFDAGIGFANSDINIAFPAGTPFQTVIATLISAIPGVTIGAIGNFAGALSKGWSASGSAVSLLFEITGGAFFIDKGKGYALKSNEFVATGGNLIAINADTGLLNTPVLEQSLARFEMLFEPSLNVGSAAQVYSLTNPMLNGLWSISSVKHKGTISPVVSGDAITIGEFVYYQTGLTPVLPISG